eukprot:TRINITY_DN8300_c0_g1_i1.p2 TRINITY_DN8300_c0_g1~~TRINITY_DN8300_c0_g1_i1.p2  ORF type:complete len:117 (-),score=29.01 TRINITY_DN8300_c0_g1_i1:124-474(-)
MAQAGEATSKLAAWCGNMGIETPVKSLSASETESQTDGLMEMLANILAEEGDDYLSDVEAADLLVALGCGGSTVDTAHAAAVAAALGVLGLYLAAPEQREMIGKRVVSDEVFGRCG